MKKEQKSSITVSIRLLPEFYNRIEALAQKGKYLNKSEFLKEAVRRHVELCERQDAQTLETQPSPN